VFNVGERKPKGMNRWLLFFLIPVVLLTGCSSQDSEGAIDPSGGLNPGAIPALNSGCQSELGEMTSACVQAQVRIGGFQEGFEELWQRI
jgi:hypothetical protein